ncbi:hypothetical protein DFQ29_007079 [Apophysomyces sp. BC1021]|nr:hypothetical protein DFQ29_007079 [Apophysomyces sp. BC1021]
MNFLSESEFVVLTEACFIMPQAMEICDYDDEKFPVNTTLSKIIGVQWNTKLHQMAYKKV